ncbi:hypothetical protein ONZ45_g10577 [Pleurotus djamor]|nr:hypothetical protein ONZ45_g10577 [Pleurotus djamor]
MTSNPRIIFAKLPANGGQKGLPVLGEHLVIDNSKTIDLNNVPLNGGFLSKTLIISPEPALRRLNFKAEEWPSSTFDMDSLALQVVPNPGGAFPLTKYTNPLGTPGLTAFVAFEEYVQSPEGKTIYVSAGGSGVGSMVIQLAKMKGMKVIASAGSDAKLEYLKSIGADVVFNYKKESYDKALAKAGPFHVYWDNVGAQALEAAIEHIDAFGTIVNTTLIFKKRLHIHGILVPDLLPKHAGQFFAEVPALLAQGKIQSKEVVVNGLENAPSALIQVLEGGEEAGKVVVVVAEE